MRPNNAAHSTRIHSGLRPVWGLFVWVLLLAQNGRSETFTIDTPAGSVDVEVNHVGPSGSLLAPTTISTPAFGPPSIFAVPLPTGSGARALGMGGAFTAVADDATAASWNPGGLTQLEWPEASAVGRWSSEKDQRLSANDDFRVGEDETDSDGLNYLSLVYPYHAFGRNWVCSLNYQEVYDFTQSFSADLAFASAEKAVSTGSQTYRDTTTAHYEDGIVELDVTSVLTTERTSVLSQLLDSEMVTHVDFEQEGVIGAISPALAVEVTPKLSVGMTANVYGTDVVETERVKSVTRADYSGTTGSDSLQVNERTTSGSYSYSGIIHWPWPVGDRAISGSGAYDAFSEIDTTASSVSLPFDGRYEEVNEYGDFRGANATLGALWAPLSRLSLGTAIDLPWKADTTQTRTIRSSVTTYDASRSRVLSTIESTDVQTEDVEFQFPLYWAVGAAWRWSGAFQTTLDISETKWSDFYYETEAGDKLNPLDGSSYDDGVVDDCWAVRCGAEYLCILSRTEIPLRVGLAREEQPAVGQPDEYWTVSTGTGVSFGKEHSKTIIDLAYSFTWGDGVLGSLVSGETGLESDVRKHAVYLSCIQHF